MNSVLEEYSKCLHSESSNNNYTYTIQNKYLFQDEVNIRNEVYLFKFSIYLNIISVSHNSEKLVIVITPYKYVILTF